MYDINLKNVKKGRTSMWIFFLVGVIIVFVFVGILISDYKKEKTLDASVKSTRVEVKESTDSDGGTMYSPVYVYEVDGKEYKCTSRTSSNIYPSEENKMVKFNSKAPGSCMTEYDKGSNMILLVFMIIPIVCIAIGIGTFVKGNKRIKIINELQTTGKLVKNLPYRMENTGTVINGVPIQKPVVDYVLPNGTTVTLDGDARNDRKKMDADGMVDLLIDPNNPENYYIDFEINRISGNLPEDYYVNPAAQMTNQPMMPGQPMQQMPGQPMQQMPGQPMQQMPGQPMNNGQYPNQNNM